MLDLVRFIKPTVPRSSSSSTSWVHKSTLAHAVTQLRSPPLFSHLGGQLRQLTYRPATTLTIVTAVLAGATVLPSVAGEHAALVWRCCPHHLSQTMHDQPYCYKEHLACGPRSATPVDVTSWSTASNPSLRIQITLIQRDRLVSVIQDTLVTLSDLDVILGPPSQACHRPLMGSGHLSEPDHYLLSIHKDTRQFVFFNLCAAKCPQVTMIELGPRLYGDAI